MLYSEGEEVRNAHTGEFGTIRKVDESEGKYLVDFGEYKDWMEEDDLS